MTRAKVFARNIRHIEDHASFAAFDGKRLSEVRENIELGDIYVAKRAMEASDLVKIREYLAQIGRNSLPNYQTIEEGCPNFHRINAWDPRAYVQACFHQFVFFPWNQDLFHLFEATRDIYRARNQIIGLPANSFLGVKPENGCTARIAFQFYPKGSGAMNKHRDPFDFHQLVVPTVAMSKKGRDFKKGGAYVEKENGERLYLDDLCEIGDVTYFNARIPHGVETIDEGAKPDWLSFEGRWVLLAAVNKLAGNGAIADSSDLEDGAGLGKARR